MDSDAYVSLQGLEGDKLFVGSGKTKYIVCKRDRVKKNVCREVK